MTKVAAPALLNAVVYLLTEAYAGPPNPAETWFIDNEPDSGILGLLAHVSAAEASRSVDGSGKPGTTIAANAEHLRWSLANANAAFQGLSYQGSWKESWALTGANDAEWDRLRKALRDEYEALLQNVQQQDDLPGEYLNGVLALVPHAAYHLGTIRQMIERVRERS